MRSAEGPGGLGDQMPAQQVDDQADPAASASAGADGPQSAGPGSDPGGPQSAGQGSGPDSPQSAGPGSGPDGPQSAGGGLTTQQIAQATAGPMTGRDGADPAAAPAGQRQRSRLLAPDELQGTLERWKEIQSGFVDEPRQAVQDADRLVAELMQRLARMFASEREQLEARWSAGDSVSTEDLRQGLQLYRSFFERLLSA